MANVFVPSANDPAVFTTDKFPLLKDGDGNTYRTVVKANVNGSFDVYSKGTSVPFRGDELLFRYYTDNEVDFTVGKFKDKPTTAFNSFFNSSASGSNARAFTALVKRRWYYEAPSSARTNMAKTAAYAPIAATTRTTPDGRVIPPGTSPTGLGNIPPEDAAPGSPAGTGPASNPVRSVTLSDIPDPLIKYAGEPRKYGDYVYPTSIRTNKQDFIKFTAYNYAGRDLIKGKNTSATQIDPTIGFADRKLKESIGSVILPIQPSITDSNTAQWGGEEMNALGAYAASASYNAQTDIAGTADAVLRDIDKIFKSGTNSSVNNAVRLFLAGKAAGVSGLLSRVGGAVLNPNLELLFQGPQLRPFNFTFRLSPRDAKEAEQVKYIIRFFKQNMCVKNSDVNLFLKTPNVFQIRYHLAGNTEGDHPSLNRIKICALQSCSVDYTPDGSYMTFNDAGATMTSYNLSLQFQELEPVTEKDYDDLKDETIIGY
jgi:hypothetical protein